MAEQTEKKEMKKEKKSGKKTGIIIGVIIAVVVVGVVAVGSIISSVTSGMQEAMEMMAGENETIFEVKRENVEQEITTSGTIVGIETNAYTSPVTAKVDDIFVEVGQTVKKGDVLIAYDASELGDNLELVQLQAQSERAAGNESFEAANEAAGKTSAAKKEIKELKSDIKALQKEIKELTKTIAAYEEKMQNASTEMGEGAEPVPTLTKKEQKAYNKAVSNLEKKNTSLASKQAKLAEQEAIVATYKDVKVSESTKAAVSAANRMSQMNVDNAKESVDAAEAGIVATEDGIVESIQIVKGSYASETQTLLTIINSDKIGVEFSISKDDLGTITKDQKARVVIGSKEYEGTVEYVSRVASMEGLMASESSAGGSIKGRIVIDNPDDDIYIGVSAKTYIFVGASDNALIIPYEALCTDIDGDYVYVVNENNLIERKDVTIGLYSGEYYEVLEGVEEGDKVITEVTKNMKPGDEYVPPVTTPGM